MTTPRSIEYVSGEEIQADLARVGKATAVNTDNSLPLFLLADRQFECLLHDLACSPGRATDKKFGVYDRALLMQGVGERGRDCALIRDGKHVGAIQCKRYQSLITKPDAARELIKYCLNSIKSPELMPDPKGFTYVFAASRDFNEKAKILLAGLATLIEQESDLAGWIREVIEEYEGLSDLGPDVVLPEVVGRLKAIKVVCLGFNELNTLLIGEDKIIQKYFAVKTVVDNEPIEALSRHVQAVLQGLADKDVKRLSDVLAAQPEDRRFDMGIFSMWGYPKRFVQALLASKEFKAIGMELVKAKASLDGCFADHLAQWVKDEIFAHVSMRHKFSPLTLSAAAPYLAGRLLDRWRRNQQGATLSKILPKPDIDTDVFGVRKKILDAGAAFLRNDWSTYVGDENLLALKKEIARHIYSPYATVEAMERQFESEWPHLEPELREIELRLEAEIPRDTIVVLRSMQWFDDRQLVVDLLTKTSALEKGTKSTEPNKLGAPPLAEH